MTMTSYGRCGLVFGVCVMLLAPLGCSDSDDKVGGDGGLGGIIGDGPAGSDAGGPKDSAAINDAPAGGDGPAGGDIVGAGDVSGGGAKGAGGVFMSSYILGMPGGPMSGNVAAAFTAAGVPRTGPPCTETQEGMCIVRSCTMLNADAGSPTDTPSTSAGVITITGGKMPITLTPASDGKYPVMLGQAVLWDGGETLTISAAGGVVPAFSVTVTAPTQFVMTAPTPNAGEIPIVRANPTTFTWTGGGAGTVSLVLTQPVTSDSLLQVVCHFPAAGGTGTVPAATLAHFKLGIGTFGAAGQASAMKEVGGWVVGATASTSPYHAITGAYQGVVNFQ